jgi:hypothetical protein
MSRTASRPLRLLVTDVSRRKGSAPALRGRAKGDVVARRALVVGGVVLATLMVILSAQSTSARSSQEVALDPPASSVEVAQL